MNTFPSINSSEAVYQAVSGDADSLAEKFANLWGFDCRCGGSTEACAALPGMVQHCTNAIAEDFVFEDGKTLGGHYAARSATEEVMSEPDSPDLDLRNNGCGKELTQSSHATPLQPVGYRSSVARLWSSCTVAMITTAPFELRPGVAFYFRLFYPLIQEAVQSACSETRERSTAIYSVRHKISGNSCLGQNVARWQQPSRC